MTDRPYTTGLYLHRCLEVGLKLSELSDLDYGTVMDIMIEVGNDDAEWHQLATQEDFDRF